MRISDWSSDVCSSDLTAHAQYERKVAAHGQGDGSERHSRPSEAAGRRHPALRRARVRPHLGQGDRRGGGRHQGGATPILDRKSVVKGKSVSVRVGFGGSRIIQNKRRLENK